jgi:hypothetical protein
MRSKADVDKAYSSHLLGAQLDAIAIAHIEAVGGAIADRVLHEPWKHLRKAWIECPGVDAGGDAVDDVGATASGVAPEARPGG